MAESILAYQTGIAVTKSDTVNDPNGPFAGFFIGDISGGATIKVTTAGGDTLSLAGLLAGVIVPIRIIRVWTTGTLAGSIIGVKGTP